MFLRRGHVRLNAQSRWQAQNSCLTPTRTTAFQHEWKNAALNASFASASWVQNSRARPSVHGGEGSGRHQGRTRASSMAEDAGADVPSYHHDEQIIPCISERWKEGQAGGKALFFRDIALYFGCSCQTPLVLKLVD